MQHYSRREAMKIGAAAVATAAAAAAMGQDKPAPATAPTADLAAYAGGKYVLPPLPYAPTALEPLYQQAMLTLHHDKHHAAYVNNLNKALEHLAANRKAGDFAHVQALSRAVAFNGSGHVLHTLFWHSMKPPAGDGKPADMPEPLAAAVADSFGSVDAFKAQFAAAARDVEASGWAILAYEPLAGKLLVLQCMNHQDLAVWGVTPLLVCDVWEHAYYLQYQNRRPEWVDNFMKLANWDVASRRYEAARKR
jgi:Fe-Mn family superoxide dismutase